jgi:hypothetical protein
MRQKTNILAVAFIALVLFATGSVSSWGCDEPRDVIVSVNAPLHVAQGEEFVFEVGVENISASTQLLYSIDIWDEYLKGISVISSEPQFTDSYHIPLDNTQSYEFKQDIPAIDKLVIKFYAVGLEPGHYSSYLDVCINTGTSFISYPIITIVDD